jgi:hypothetical protein
LGIVSFIESDGVLLRWAVFGGWVVFALFAFLGLFRYRGLRWVALGAPKEGLAAQLNAGWMLVTMYAVAPLILAVAAAQYNARTGTSITYPVRWGAAITLLLLLRIVPSVARIRRLDEERMAVDGVSVVSALAKATETPGRGRRSLRR